MSLGSWSRGFGKIGKMLRPTFNFPKVLSPYTNLGQVYSWFIITFQIICILCNCFPCVKLKSPTPSSQWVSSVFITGLMRYFQEEKIVYKIIEDAGNKGTWIRDIRINSNLVQTQLNKVLKSLESKKLIKVVKSVNATKKKVYM